MIEPDAWFPVGVIAFLVAFWASGFALAVNKRVYPNVYRIFMRVAVVALFVMWGVIFHYLGFL